jgi:uncharacterized membrane protein YeaQ/YmgE (transglycosylase-associated protein family)
MMMSSIIGTLVIGLVAGWLAGRIVKGRGFGVIGNLVVGVIGALLGGFLFGSVFITGGMVGHLLSALAGSVIFLFLLKLIK